MTSTESKMVVGITGGIGAGKSYICRYLSEMGYPVYNTDARARALMNESEEIRHRLTHEFGSGCYDENGLDRAFLAEKIFGNASNLKLVNSIVHPVVRADFRAWVERQVSHLVFVESAILFESGFDQFVDYVWSVSAPVEVRIDRITGRDSTSREQAMKRISSQMPQEEKDSRADWVVDNAGTSDVRGKLQNQIIKISSGFAN